MMKFNLEKVYFSSPIWMQNFFVSIYGLNLWSKRYSGDFKKILKDVHATRYKSRNDIREQQLVKLKEMLVYCKENIPYYQELFKSNGIDVREVQSLDDLNCLPILEKETIKNNKEAFIPPNCKSKKNIKQQTSGSTGTPLSLNVDMKTYRLAMALLVEHESLSGLKRWDKRATFAGRQVQSVDNNRPPFWRYNVAENQMLFSSYHLSEVNLPFYVKKINLFKPNEIIGYPSAIFSFASYCDQQSISLSFQPKVIVTNSETLLAWQRETIERVFKCNVWDYYGTAEYVVFSGQCEALNYHTNPLLGVLEVVDEKGTCVHDQIGEIVGTTLTNFAMPLLRYRIGDIGALSSISCTCGCHYPILKSVEGRKDDVVVTKDGKKIGRLDHIFKGISSVKECQIIQQTLEDFTLKLVRGKGFKEKYQEQLITNLKNRVGKEVSVNIQYVEKIERTARGKFKGVLNLCKP